MEKNVAEGTALVVGGGVIGASWSALFLSAGMNVIVADPDPRAPDNVRGFVEAARSDLERLGRSAPRLDRLSFTEDAVGAAASVAVVQECGPEKEAFKVNLWHDLEDAAPNEALLLSSSSSIVATLQSARMRDPGRLVIGHPFNPPHLVPLVEIVPGEATSAETTERVVRFYRALGKTALVIRREIPGFVANRLQAAIFKECVALVRDGIVSAGDLDAIVTSSLGIRWASDGPFLSFHLGGGPGGFAHFLEHLAPGMEALWRTMSDVSYDEVTRKLLIEEVQAAYGGTGYAELASARDRREIAVMRSLDGQRS